MTYRAPLDDIRLAIDLAGGGAGRVDADLQDSILEGAAEFAEGVLAPLDRVGDRTPARLDDGKVVTAPGWKDAYRRFAEGGWTSLSGPEDFGGQNLPHVLSSSVIEIWSGANLSFGLCPLLTQGAVEAMRAAASPDLMARFAPRMISGEWAGTMNLTEAHAGTDLGALKTRATPHGDGTYRIFGTKVYITYGDHELTSNIVHLVLARVAGAPEGTRGISLFLVPKFLLNAVDMPGERNDVRATGLEHKLGIHGSPTCVMSFGEQDGALGYLVGEEGRGLNNMFVMMNRARLDVGLQGVAVAERATQRAIAYARERRQGRSATSAPNTMAPIIEHPDIRRTLAQMRAKTSAARLICLQTAHALDLSERSHDAAARAEAASLSALLTPVAKAFATDTAVEVASMGVQVHGGSGFIEATGAAQHYRDARILPIYEGTNGVQAIDLVTRKLPLDGGRIALAYLDKLDAGVRQLEDASQPAIAGIAPALREANAELRTATQWLLAEGRQRPEAALAGATRYLELFGLAAGGAALGAGALQSARTGETAPAHRRRIDLARFFAAALSPAAQGLCRTVVSGDEALPRPEDAAFAE